MKVFILTDLEGVSGVKGRSDGIGNSIVNEDVSKRLLTEEVNATAEGLLAGGATEIVCWDGHGGSNSINIEQLHPEVQLYQSDGLLQPLPIDASFDAFVHIGAHAMMGVADGFLHHSFNSHAVVCMSLNGEPIGEIGIESVIAACYGMPTILVSGDRAACREAAAFLGKVDTVETKTGISRYSAVNKNPERVRAGLTAAAQQALKAKDTFPIVRKEPPYELKIELMCPNMADECEKKGAQRINHTTVMYSGSDFPDVWAQRNGWAPGVYKARFGSSAVSEA